MIKYSIIIEIVVSQDCLLIKVNSKEKHVTNQILKVKIKLIYSNYFTLMLALIKSSSLATSISLKLLMKKLCWNI